MPPSSDEPTQEAAAREVALVVVSVGGVELGLPARSVTAVSGVDTPTPIPGAPGHILGLVATGDRVLALVDLAAFLDLGGDSRDQIARRDARWGEPPRPERGEGGREGPPIADPMFRRALIVTAGALEAGLVCERARGMLGVEKATFKPPAVLQGERLKAFLVAEVQVSGRVIGVLDPTALLEAAAVQ